MRACRRCRRKAAKKNSKPLILELALLTARAMLQRLDTIEHEQYAPLRKRLRELLALECCARRIDCDAQLAQRPVEEAFCRCRPLLCALAIEGPAEDNLGAAIIVGLQALQPLVDQ